MLSTPVTLNNVDDDSESSGSESSGSESSGCSGCKSQEEEVKHKEERVIGGGFINVGEGRPKEGREGIVTIIAAVQWW